MQATRHTSLDPAAARRGRPNRTPLSLIVLTASFAGLVVSSAHAQVAAATPQVTAPSAEVIKQHEQELEAARAQQKSTAELQEKLKADIAALGQDRSKLNQQLIDIAARVRGIETRIVDAEARLRPLDAREQ
jgi:septal ring factor EnvC (AmiA/AmiB activator)